MNRKILPVGCKFWKRFRIFPFAELVGQATGYQVMRIAMDGAESREPGGPIAEYMGGNEFSYHAQRII